MSKQFKNLTEEDKEYLSFIYFQEMTHNEKITILSNKFGVVGRTIRKWWVKLDLKELPSKLPLQLKEAQKREIPIDTDIILFTAAQNKTIPNISFLENLKSYKEYLQTNFNKKVEIVISGSRYRNPTSLIESDKTKTDMWWEDSLVPFLYYGKYLFGDTLISTDTRIRPTAKEPLTGYEVLAKDNHLVLPHSKIHFKPLPRFKNHPLRVMTTTGFITRKNYSESKAGETANEHHSYGFVIVEKKEDGTCHIPRNVKVKDDGSFIDIIYKVENNKVSTIDKSSGFVWGDIHADEIKQEVFDYTLNNLYPILKPKKTVLHDVLNGSSVNPHEKDDFFIQKRKIVEGKYKVKDEVQHSFDIISLIKSSGTEVNVVLSNHEIFLDRYINKGDWKKDLHNSETYLKYALIQQEKDLRQYGTIYGYLLHEYFKGEVNYINYGASLRIEGYECALHADNGVNGARGSYKTFSKLNTKMIGGHSHTPIIHNGYTGVGVTCEIDQYYTRKGLSSWAYAHSVIHHNSKNQLLVFGDDFKISSLI